MEQARCAAPLSNRYLELASHHGPEQLEQTYKVALARTVGAYQDVDRPQIERGRADRRETLDRDPVQGTLDPAPILPVTELLIPGQLTRPTGTGGTHQASRRTPFGAISDEEVADVGGHFLFGGVVL